MVYREEFTEYLGEWSAEGGPKLLKHYSKVAETRKLILGGGR